MSKVTGNTLYFICCPFLYAVFRLLAWHILFKRAVSPKSQQMLRHCDVWTWNIVAGTPHTCPRPLRSPPVCLHDDNLVLYRGCQRESPEKTCKIIGVTWWPETLTDQTLHPINCWLNISGSEFITQHPKIHLCFDLFLGYFLPTVFVTLFLFPLQSLPLWFRSTQSVTVRSRIWCHHPGHSKFCRF